LKHLAGNGSLEVLNPSPGYAELFIIRTVNSTSNGIKTTKAASCVEAGPFSSPELEGGLHQGLLPSAFY
jgi:hypothetical protein